MKEFVTLTEVVNLSQRSFEEGGTYQEIDGAAHAVVAAVVAHHRPVIEETNKESLHQGDKVLHLGPQRGLLSSAVQQAGRQAAMSYSSSAKSSVKNEGPARGWQEIHRRE